MKECNWCKEKVKEDAKACPNCGKPIWNEKDKKRVTILGIIVGILFIILFLIVLIILNPASKAKEMCKDAPRVTLEDVYELHAKNVPQAKEKYEGKYFIIEGKLSKVLDNYAKIENKYITANVYFNKDDKEKVNKMKNKEKVTFCGKVDYGLGINIKDAMLIEKK